MRRHLTLLRQNLESIHTKIPSVTKWRKKQHEKVWSTQRFFFLSSHPQLPEIKFEVSSNQLAAVTLSFASIEDPPFYLFFLELVKSLFGKEECRIGNKTRAPHPIDVEEYDICTSFLSQRVLLRELPPLGLQKADAKQIWCCFLLAFDTPRK